MIISLDTETSGIDFRHGCKPFFVTVANEKLGNTYWEWDVNPLTRQPKPKKRDLREIQEVIDSADEIVLQNAKFDYAALRTIYGDKLRWDWSKVHDTLIAGHLLKSNQAHDLTTMAAVYLSINIQPYEDSLEESVKKAQRLGKQLKWKVAKTGLPELPSVKGKLWKFDGWLPRAIIRNTKISNEGWDTVLRVYANCDSATTMALFLKQRKLLKKLGLWEIYLSRMRVVPVVAAMEEGGVIVSKSRLEKLHKDFTKEAKIQEAVCLDIAKKHEYELVLPKGSNNNSLKKFVFEVLNLKSSKKTATGQPSLDKQVMEEWESLLSPKTDGHKFITALMAKRKRGTAISYMDSYKRFWLPYSDDSILQWYILYSSLNITGTDTLRFSSANPNQQNISKQEGFSLRPLFGPLPDEEWWALDYENIELRIPAYESGESELIKLFEHPNDPPYYGSVHLLNFHTVYPDIWKEAVKKVGVDEAGKYCKKEYSSTYYQWCKNGDFAVQYGAIERTDKVGTADRAFHRSGSHAKLRRRFSRQNQLNQRYIAMANELGYVETMPDRTVNPEQGYPLYCTRSSYGKIIPTVPLNYHVQGTAMWCTCKAMVRCYEYLQKVGIGRIVLQVHDEMVFCFPKVKNQGNLKYVKRLQHLMEKSGDDIGVPLKVSVSYHPNNWGESE